MVDITSSRLLLAIKFSNSVPITLAKAVGHFCFVDSVGFMQDNVKGLQKHRSKGTACEQGHYLKSTERLCRNSG